MVTLLATGGTIAAGGRRAAELVGARPLVPVDFDRIPSCMMTPPRMLALARRIEAIDGPVVVTHGTDAMEETAFFLDVVLSTPHTVVMTGAMERVWPGDGSDNLDDAAAVARAVRGLGVLVVMDGVIHSARQVCKRHTRQRDAFRSPGLGIARPTVALHRQPPRRRQVTVDAVTAQVDLVRLVAGDDGRLLRVSTADGVVVEALGEGNVPAGAMAAIGAHPGVVVMTSRTGAGPVRLDARAKQAGVIATDLDGLKARLALLLGLSAGLEHDALAALLQG